MSPGSAKTSPGWAVIVGINAPGGSFPPLECCVRDAIALYALLTHRAHTNLSPDQVHLLLDGEETDIREAAEWVKQTLESGHNVTVPTAFVDDVVAKRIEPQREDIFAAVDAVAQNATADDLLLFYFAGHGSPSNGEVFLVSPKAKKNALARTAIPLRAVKEDLAKSKARHAVLLLDGCYSGSTRPHANERLREELLTSHGEIAILASSLPWEESHEELVVDGQGIFTKFLVEGLCGRADSTAKGWVTLYDLSQYVIGEVKGWIARHVELGRLQTPCLNDVGVHLGHHIAISGRIESRPDDFSHDLYVSVAREDVPVIRTLVEGLRAEGCRVRLDENQVAVTPSVLGGVATAITQSEQMLVCLSDEYFRDDLSLFEFRHNQSLERGQRSDRTILIIVRPLSDPKRSDIDTREAIDLTPALAIGGVANDPALNRLRHRIRGRSDLSRFASPQMIQDLQREADTNKVMARLIQDSRQVYIYIWLREKLGAVPAKVDDLTSGLRASGRLPREVLTQIDTIQRYAALIELPDIKRGHIQPGVHALAELSDWVTKKYDVVQTWTTEPDSLSALWRELGRRSGSGRPRVPDAPYELSEGQRFDRLGAIYPGRNVNDQSPVEIVVMPLATNRVSAFDVQSEGCRSLDTSAAVAVESWGRFEWPDGSPWGFLVLRRADAVPFGELEKRFRPLSDYLAGALVRQAVTSHAVLNHAFPALARALFERGMVGFDHSGVARVVWDWTRIDSDSGSDAPAARKRDEFWLCRTDAAATLKDSVADLLSHMVESLGGTSPAVRTAFEQVIRAGTSEPAVAEDLRSEQPALATDQESVQVAVGCYLRRRPLPAWLVEARVEQPEPDTKPAVPPATPFQLRSEIPVDCHAAWPLSDDRLLAWDAERILGIYNVDGGAGVWHDEAEIEVRRATRGPDGGWGIGGWEGEIRWFAAGRPHGRAHIGWTVGSIQPYRNHWLVGSWNGRLMLVGIGQPQDLLRVEDGVFKIAVSDTNAVVLGLRGSVSGYRADGERLWQTTRIDGAIDVAFANGFPVVLTNDGLVTIEQPGHLRQPDPLPARESVRLQSGNVDGGCLLLNARGQSWRVDRRGTYPRAVTFPSGHDSLMTSEDGRRCTVGTDGDGWRYWRDGELIRHWPDAASAALSGSGRTIVVTRPSVVEVWEHGD